MTSWIKFYNDELDKGYTSLQALKRVREKYRRQIDDLISKIKNVDFKKEDVKKDDEEEDDLDAPLSYKDELQIQLEISRCHLHFINRRLEKEREMEKNKKT